MMYFKSNYPSKHLDFLESNLPDRKTAIYDVMSKFDRCRLGVVKWRGPWRQYVFFPEEEYQTIWSHDCLLDLSEFIKQLMDERKKVKE